MVKILPNDTPAGTQRARAKILPRGGGNLAKRHTGRHTYIEQELKSCQEVVKILPNNTPAGTQRARAKFLPRGGENFVEQHTGRRT